jgi:hypothetical protein
LTAIATSIVTILFNKTLINAIATVRLLGMLAFLGLNGLVVYLILSTTAMSASAE